MRIAFTKMHGAGNDFVVVDHREPFLPADAAPLITRLCDRRRGVGADGVLLLERDPELDFAMRYWNADGGLADFCGNGARCLVRFALERGLGRGGRVRFRTDAGPKTGWREPDGRVSVDVGAVTRPEPVTVEAAGRSFEGGLVTVGVPHLVVPVTDLASVPVGEWAPPLRRHPRFGAAGANVDFVEPRAGAVAMRTWERGVEGETLACGSGAVATALWAVGAGSRPPVTVHTSGGDDLVVAIRRGPDGEAATLTGPAEVAFTGEWAGSPQPADTRSG